MTSPVITSLCAELARAGIPASPHVEMSACTTFRLGGPCLGLVDCRSPGELEAAVRAMLRAGVAFTLIGGGSNLLVSDHGLDTMVIRYACGGAPVQVSGPLLDVGAGMSLDSLAAFSVEQGLAGLVYCSGIPGTVGGAIAGNAGAFGKQLGDHVVSVRVMDRTGAVREVEGGELRFAYRASRLQETGEIVVSARLRLEAGQGGVLRQERADILALRREKHPDWHTQPTAGSFFKNIEPTSAAGRRQAAGWFLEQAGAKSMKVGGARVFEKHANIIIAGEGCKAQDVLDLAHRMEEAVRAMFGLVLQREVRVLGAFS